MCLISNDKHLITNIIPEPAPESLLLLINSRVKCGKLGEAEYYNSQFWIQSN